MLRLLCFVTATTTHDPEGPPRVCFFVHPSKWPLIFDGLCGKGNTLDRGRFFSVGRKLFDFHQKSTKRLAKGAREARPFVDEAFLRLLVQFPKFATHENKKQKK